MEKIYFLLQDSLPIDESQENKVDLYFEKILVKLDELSLKSSFTSNNFRESEDLTSDQISNCDNLLDLRLCKNVSVQMLDDGCTISCALCTQYCQSNAMNM